MRIRLMLAVFPLILAGCVGTDQIGLFERDAHSKALADVNFCEQHVPAAWPTVPACLEHISAIRGAAAPSGASDSGPSVREQIRQQCIRRQIMEQGRGGPAPNFADC